MFAIALQSSFFIRNLWLAVFLFSAPEKIGIERFMPVYALLSASRLPYVFIPAVALISRFGNLKDLTASLMRFSQVWAVAGRLARMIRTATNNGLLYFRKRRKGVLGTLPFMMGLLCGCTTGVMYHFAGVISSFIGVFR